MPQHNFPKLYKELTNSSPFPWQEAIFADFIEGKIPESANLPTGLGKTSIVAIWLCALALAPRKTPRRLVYVVNRRTVLGTVRVAQEVFFLLFCRLELVWRMIFDRHGESMSFWSIDHLERGTSSSFPHLSSSAVLLCRSLWMPNHARVCVKTLAKLAV